MRGGRVGTRRAAIGGIVAAASLVIGVAGAPAATVNLPTHLTGFGGNAYWGATGSDTNGDGFVNNVDVCPSTGDGFGMQDAALLIAPQVDAFDGAGVIHAEGSTDAFQVPGGSNAPVDVTGSTLTTPSGPLPGTALTSTVQWTAFDDQPVIRELVSLSNPTGATITQRVRMDLNFGSDESTYAYGSGSGDQAWTTADHWIATADSADPSDFDGSGAADHDPPLVTVLQGQGDVAAPIVVLDNCGESGSPEQTPAENAHKDQQAAAQQAQNAAKQTTPTDGTSATPKDVTSGTLLPTCPDGSVDQSCDTWSVGYDVTIPAGQTRFLMFFWGLYQTPNDAANAGPSFDTMLTDGSLPPTDGGGPGGPVEGGAVAAPLQIVPGVGAQALAPSLLSGLSPNQLALIVNWAPTANVIPKVAPRFTG